jgi:hypothetical protein
MLKWGMFKITLALFSILLIFVFFLPGCVSSQKIQIPQINQTPETTLVSPTAIQTPSYTPMIGDPIISELQSLNSLTDSAKNHNFFLSADEFSFKLRTAKDIKFPWSKFFQVKLINKSASSYAFEMVEGSTLFNIDFPSVKYNDIKLVPGMIYQIKAIPPVNIFANNHFLLICQGTGNEIIFIGLSGGILETDGLIRMWPQTYPILDASIKGLLNDNYWEYETDTEYRKITNQEILFSLGDKTFSIHQGQFAILGDYRIDLTLAISRETQYKRQVVVDSIPNTFSFTFTKLVESPPFSINSTGNY